MKEYKKMTLGAAAVIILYYAVRESVGLLVSFLNKKGCFEGADAYLRTLINFVIYAIVLLFTCFAASKLMGKSFKSCFEGWRDEEPEYLLPFTVRGTELIIFVGMISSVLASKMSEFGISSPLPDETSAFSKEQWFGILLTVLFDAVAAGFLEELLFRGFIMKSFIKFNPTAAAILSALLFALPHIYPAQMVFAFGAGLVIAHYDLRYGSIKIGIILHIINNYVSIMLNMAAEYLSDERYISTVFGYYSTVIVLGIVSRFIIMRIDAKRPQNELSGEERVPAAKLIFQFIWLIPIAVTAFFMIRETF